jgi:Domain of Unknown Function (DUF1080)
MDGGAGRVGQGYAMIGRWRTAAAIVLMLAAGACEAGEPGATPASPAPTTAASVPPAEAPSPDASGWVVLFDGTVTDALRGYGMTAFPADRWVVEGDALATVPSASIDLITRDTFGDFELEFEWRVAAGGNSGVMYRVAETADPAWASGPEYQVLDDERHPDGRDPTTSAAALYDLIAPNGAKRLEPVGSFNRGRIVVRNDRVEHWLNDALVVEYGWNDEATRGLVASSKFASLEGFMAEASGHVVFQHHGEAAAFRSIRIRRLGDG